MDLNLGSEGMCLLKNISVINVNSDRLLWSVMCSLRSCNRQMTFQRFSSVNKATYLISGRADLYFIFSLRLKKK